MRSEKPKPSKILLTGGGTGGHLAIVRSVKEELLRRGIRPCYIGSESGQDRAWFGEDADFEAKRFLPTRGVVNQRGFGKLASMAQVFKATLQARRFIKAHGIEAVLSVGGFSAAPASFAAILTGTPLFIHEQNAVSGRLNRILEPFAKRFFSSYGDDRIDYPVGEIFFQTARLRTEVETVIFLGGSQGAKAINDFALELAPELRRRGIRIVHQTGNLDYERIKGAYEALGIEADVFAFDKELYKRIAQADFAVSRAGASTLWELAANRIPTLFVPYPYAAGDHQYHNARYIVERNAGWIVRQNALKSDLFWDIIDKENIAPVSEKLATMIGPDGARKIVESMLAEGR
ncbi:undecaprenyldiphospho-muramoylpentapeptide beta-N-acetylglucosaminyltransferase [Hydrogenimonas cancrithermarum]|uniref:UDP-N-acetylglucosamine--N-acetylmuramyl-(pentapeptide) pyrophosphoryl-undecaprenol N-acetylglucosamine transferase n=1 Tax=Hydrogenimonas cancrithermarum TaxID=2993563 RepID=A0ABN6WW97_9BACT|nr:undecaprenyldiphospho-muramoylpentapeptide beta-N-acetylglucosaminyltransferase [Hydrogenimonas cancrithermarum]BDY13316.1 UDP-N-acetylglucosamine--N-acetylmuramyl-(pentapeptide) pyrophosphoryl-undecaprenol N-acetylglucosamine transferase [Hydrogenimonas cancrithermarum]